MNASEILNYVIAALLAYIGFNGKQLINRIDKFEKKAEDIMISSVGDKKDIEILRRDVDDHEVRITQLEK